MKVWTTRLLPGTDVTKWLTQFCAREHVSAGILLASVGSLTQVSLRYAAQSTYTLTIGDLEILSLSGMVSSKNMHVHCSVSDSKGHCLGGHLGEGSVVRTTLEISIGVLQGERFEREPCAMSGYDELVVYHEMKETPKKTPRVEVNDLDDIEVKRLKK